MLNANEIYNLGQVLDRTWGRSTTNLSGSPEWSITCQLVNDTNVKLTYTTIVNLCATNSMHDDMRMHESTGVDLIEQCIKQIKSDYKELSGTNLKLKLVRHIPEIEMLSMSAYNPKRTAYFRVIAIAEYDV